MWTFPIAFLFSFLSIAADFPAGKLPAGVKPLEYNLALTINPKETKFTGKAQIKLQFDSLTKQFWMHGTDLRIKKAELESGAGTDPVTYEQVSPEGVVLIQLTKPIKAGQATLKIDYEANYQTDLAGLYRVTQNKLNYVYSQFEPISARTCFPSFDEPRFKIPFNISLTIPSTDTGLSNGLLKQEIKHPNKTKTLIFEPTKSLPTYLIAFAVGPFDVVAGPKMGKTPLRGITPKGQSQQITYALAETPKLVKILEDYFGIPYPYSKLDIIAVPDFAAGAMENAGAITFRDSLLLMNKKTAPVSQIRHFAEVMAHELAHQWFGNLVTLAWWEDLWLNEAFASWMADKVIEQYEPSYHANWDSIAWTQEAMRADSLTSSRRIQEPVHSHHDIYSAFDAITYTKGAAVIDMFENFIGAGIFQRGVRSYLTRFANRNADTNDFISELSKAYGHNLAPSFGSFLTQSGVPLIAFKKDRYTQERYLPFGSELSPHKTWAIPFCPDKTPCQMLTKSSGTLSDFGFPTKNGRGYYRFAGDYPFDASTLGDSDQIAQIANLKASFQSGLLNTTGLLPQLAGFCKSSNRHIAIAPMSTLRWLRDHVIPKELEPKLVSYAQNLYSQKPLISEPDEKKLFEAEYLEFEANIAKNPKIRQELVQKALSYLKKPTSIDSNEIKICLSVLIQERPNYFSKLVSILGKSNDAIQRTAIVMALAESDQALDMILSPKLRKNEVLPLLREYVVTTEDPERGLSWLKENLNALLAAIPAKSSGHLPWAAGSLCSEDHAQQVEALFEPIIEKLPGGPRSLEGVVEQIKLCSALVNRQRANALEFFAR